MPNRKSLRKQNSRGGGLFDWWSNKAPAPVQASFFENIFGKKEQASEPVPVPAGGKRNKKSLKKSKRGGKRNNKSRKN